MQLPADVIEDRIENWPVARLATSRSDGRPSQVPVVFARASGWLWSPVDGKPKAERELARVRNVLREPRVSLLLDEYEPDWTRLWWLRIDGEARVVRARPETDPEVAEAVEALRAKYPQYSRVPVLRDPPTLLAIRVEWISSWCAGLDAVSPAGARS